MGDGVDILDRLYRRLLEAVERERPGDAGQTFTIADVYQQLVPYRGVRGELGIVELAEYEHALLRLLAGERGYLHIELPAVREELERELVSTHPILGIYRDYAAVEVRLERGTVPEEPPAPPAPPPVEQAPVIPASPADPTAACPGCGEPLPDERDVRFCPHCGTDLGPVPCRECGTPLKSEWHFCIRCGTRR